jgi:hypothetical protein
VPDFPVCDTIEAEKSKRGDDAMTQTFETTIPELLKKWNLGQIDIPEDATICVTYSDAPKTTAPVAVENANPVLQLLHAQIEEANNATPDEIANANDEWHALKAQINDTRRANGERPLYREG